MSLAILDKLPKSLQVLKASQKQNWLISHIKMHLNYLMFQMIMMMIKKIHYKNNEIYLNFKFLFVLL